MHNPAALGGGMGPGGGNHGGGGQPGLAGENKRRTIYFGNLAAGQVRLFPFSE